MSDQDNSSRDNKINLSLHLALPHSPPPRILDLGSELSLNSQPMPTATSEVSAGGNVSEAATVVSEAGMHSQPHPRYSPFRSSLPPAMPAEDPINITTASSPEYITGANGIPSYSPSYSPDSPAYVTARQPHLSGDSTGDELSFAPRVPVRGRPWINMLSARRPSPALVGRAVGTNINENLQEQALGSRINENLQEQAFGASFGENLQEHALGGSINCKAPADVALEEEDNSRRCSNASDFQCNICFDTAEEPVVTSCGHLFCWPCLYKWLHLHSDYEECAVCKGKVTEANTFPIFGHGRAKDAKERRPEGGAGMKIPPRPRGNRLENLRQSPIPPSRRLWQRTASASPSRREGIRSGGLPEPTPGAPQEVFDRVMLRRILRQLLGVVASGNGADAQASGESGTAASSAVANSTTAAGQSLELLRRFSLHGRQTTDSLVAVAAELNRVAGEFAAMSSRLAASSIPPPPLEPQAAAAATTDDGPASSTTGVIRGDTGGNAGMWIPSRRARGGSGAAAVDEDADGGSHGRLAGRKRRRTT